MHTCIYKKKEEAVEEEDEEEHGKSVKIEITPVLRAFIDFSRYH